MTISIKTPMRSATLATIVDALEKGVTLLDLQVAAAPQGSTRYANVDGTWRIIDGVTRVQIRLLFERKGFRPVSNRMLVDALAVANLPILGSKRP